MKMTIQPQGGYKMQWNTSSRESYLPHALSCLTVVHLDEVEPEPVHRTSVDVLPGQEPRKLARLNKHLRPTRARTADVERPTTKTICEQQHETVLHA